MVITSIRIDYFRDGGGKYVRNIKLNGDEFINTLDALCEVGDTVKSTLKGTKEQCFAIWHVWYNKIGFFTNDLWNCILRVFV